MPSRPTVLARSTSVRAKRQQGVFAGRGRPLTHAGRTAHPVDAAGTIDSHAKLQPTDFVPHPTTAAVAFDVDPPRGVTRCSELHAKAETSRPFMARHDANLARRGWPVTFGLMRHAPPRILRLHLLLSNARRGTAIPRRRWLDVSPPPHARIHDVFFFRATALSVFWAKVSPPASERGTSGEGSLGSIEGYTTRPGTVPLYFFSLFLDPDMDFVGQATTYEDDSVCVCIPISRFFLYAYILLPYPSSVCNLKIVTNPGQSKTIFPTSQSRDLPNNEVITELKCSTPSRLRVNFSNCFCLFLYLDWLLGYYCILFKDTTPTSTSLRFCTRSLCKRSGRRVGNPFG